MTSPASFPPNRKLLGRIAVALLLIAFAFVCLDRAVSTWSHDTLHRPHFFELLTHVVDPTIPAAMIALIGSGLAVAFGWRPGEAGKTLLAASFSLLVAFAVKEQLQYAFGRTWPETWTNNNPSWITHHVIGFHPFHGGTGWLSFPSGHMTRITTVATVIWVRLPKWRWLAVTLTVLVAAGLIGCDFHFISDMVAGTFVGIACALGVMAFGGVRPASA